MMRDHLLAEPPVHFFLGGAVGVAKPSIFQCSVVLLVADGAEELPFLFGAPFSISIVNSDVIRLHIMLLILLHMNG